MASEAECRVSTVLEEFRVASTARSPVPRRMTSRSSPLWCRRLACMCSGTAAPQDNPDGFAIRSARVSRGGRQIRNSKFEIRNLRGRVGFRIHSLPTGILSGMPMTSSGWGRRTGVYAASIAFALLAVVLARLGAISVSEAMWVSASVALAFVPSGLWGGAGFRRRAAEAALVPAAFALTMVGGAAMRWMLVPPLLLLASWAAVAGAWERTPTHRRPLLAALLGLSARAAVGLGLTGFGVFAVGAAVVVTAVAPWAAARRSGRRAAELAALAAAVVPWQRWPLVALAVVAGCLAWG